MTAIAPEQLDQLIESEWKYLDSKKSEWSLLDGEQDMEVLEHFFKIL